MAGVLRAALWMRCAPSPSAGGKYGSSSGSKRRVPETASRFGFCQRFSGLVGSVGVGIFANTDGFLCVFGYSRNRLRVQLSHKNWLNPGRQVSSHAGVRGHLPARSMAGQAAPRDLLHPPWALAIEGNTRACLHAKCIIIDDHRALITSANFTTADHRRNIEAGTVITDSILARALRAQFDTLVDRAALQRVPGLRRELSRPIANHACRRGRTKVP